MSAVSMVLIATLPAVHKVKSFYFIWILASFFFYGGHYSILPTVVAKLFGPLTGSKVYAVVFSGFAIGTILGVILSKVIIPKRKHLGAGAYTPIFYAQAGLMAVAFIANFFFKEVPIKKKYGKDNYSALEDEAHFGKGKDIYTSSGTDPLSK